MQGGQEAMPPKFIAYAGILCVDSSVPNQILLPVSSQSICPQTICWVKTSLFLVPLAYSQLASLSRPAMFLSIEPLDVKS